MEEPDLIESITYEKGCAIVKMRRRTISNGACYHMTIPLDLSKMRDSAKSDAPTK